MRILVIFQDSLCSATSMESSRRDVLNDMAEHRPTLKNNQNTSYLRIFSHHCILQNGCFFIGRGRFFSCVLLWLIVAWLVAAMACWARPGAARRRSCRASWVAGGWTAARSGCWAGDPALAAPGCPGPASATCPRRSRSTASSPSRRP